MRLTTRLALVAACWVCSHSSPSASGSAGAVGGLWWGQSSFSPRESVETISYLVEERGFCLGLRGGGKGGCKVKHLSKVKEGRRMMMGRHAFPNLNLGANHGVKGKASTSKALAPVTEATARQVATASTAMVDNDSDESLSSWEVEEVNKRMVKRVNTMREILPENGLIPLTNLGSKTLGALEIMHTYKGRPIKILKRPRPPEHGDVWAWGSNYDGQLGIGDGCKIDRWSPTRLLFIPDGAVDAVAAGAEHSLLLRADGRVLGCGMNACGQLGTGNATEPKREFAPATAIRGRVEAVAAGGLHSLAVLRSGDLIAWGDNSSGQVGPSLASVHGRLDADPRGLLESLGLKDLSEEDVKAMSGQLIEALREEQEQIQQGILPQPPTRVLDPELAKRKRRKWWAKLAAASAITTPVVIEGVGCRGAHTVLAAGSTFSLARGPDGLIRQWGTLPWEQEEPNNGYHPIPETVQDLPSTVVGLWAGASHCLAVLASGELFSWGSNALGQLGDITDGHRSHAAAVMSGVKSAAAGGNLSLALMDNGEVYIWGAMSEKDIFRDPRKVQGLPSAAVAVSAGGGTCAVVLEDGSVWTWGRNERGQCGRGRGGRKGPPNFVKYPTHVKGVRTDAVCLAMGGKHALAITKEGVRLVGAPHDAGAGAAKALTLPAPTSTAAKLPSLAAHSAGIEAVPNRMLVT